MQQISGDTRLVTDHPCPRVAHVLRQCLRIFPEVRQVHNIEARGEMVHGRPGDVLRNQDVAHLSPHSIGLMTKGTRSCAHQRSSSDSVSSDTGTPSSLFFFDVRKERSPGMKISSVPGRLRPDFSLSMVESTRSMNCSRGINAAMSSIKKKCPTFCARSRFLYIEPISDPIAAPESTLLNISTISASA